MMPEQVPKTTTIEERHLEIEERGVKLRLTIVDTPGFNDSLNASKWSVFGELMVSIWRISGKYWVH